ncbi:39937_t:CDS:2 [Gigaspora margarita]|uniref:39937_t:CDS:1 n=1 Tax=Gigaspora margarita TaxID=4874 RepID=A0ABN7UB10_GIGMA|nr:39937_t:CDS:2 [Gigaspora margarita]
MEQNMKDIREIQENVIEPEDLKGEIYKKNLWITLKKKLIISLSNRIAKFDDTIKKWFHVTSDKLEEYYNRVEELRDNRKKRISITRTKRLENIITLTEKYTYLIS